MTRTEEVTTGFRERGFAVIEDLVSAEGVEGLRRAYDEVIAGDPRAGGNDRQLGGITRQVMQPHAFHEGFADSEAIDAARRYAEPLIGVEAPPLFFSMLIYKPPGHPHTTPWHQDVSYLIQPCTPAGVTLPYDGVAQFWIALDDVDEEMGCMEFMPGVHRDPMPAHRVASGDPAKEERLLEVADPEAAFDLSAAVPCPVRAGSATVHSYSTPHYTGPNRSASRGRRAFIVSFANLETLARASAQVGEVGVRAG